MDLHDDVKDGPRPDVVASVLDLPFADGEFERAYCGHVLEHVALSDLLAALEEIRRVLSEDGMLLIVGPDLHLTEVHEPVLVSSVLHGGGRWAGDEHRWVPTLATHAAYVTAAGFQIHAVALDEIPLDWPIVARHPWQFALLATPT